MIHLLHVTPFLLSVGGLSSYFTGNEGLAVMESNGVVTIHPSSGELHAHTGSIISIALYGKLGFIRNLRGSLKKKV